MKIRWTLVGDCFDRTPKYAEVAELDEKRLAQCETEEQVSDYIFECIRQDFEAKAIFDCYPIEQRKVLDKWQQLRKEAKN